MLPRRCTFCRCYVAPQLKRCPKCKKLAPAIIPAAQRTKEERAERNAREEAKLPVLSAAKIKWKPSAFSLDAHRGLEHEVTRKIHSADTPAMRNALRSELRAVRAVLRRGEQANGSCWVREFQYELSGSVAVFISPKGRRYVIAEKDETADLLIKHRIAGMPMIRLARFEKSAVCNRIELEKKIAKQAMVKAVAKAKAKATDKKTKTDTLLQEAE